jgi:uncharacterized protein
MASMQTIGSKEPLATEVVAAIHQGDVARLQALLAEHPGLATVRVEDDDCENEPKDARTLLHITADWPGHRPNGPAIVGVLVAAGADVDGQFVGAHTETALHWAASNDDVELLDALLDAGADIEAPGAVIAGGTPLTDAVAFGQWKTARRLVERGAVVPLREAAALGLLDRMAEQFAADPAPSLEDVTQALWYACHGGQQTAADYLLDRGGDLNWVSTWDETTPLDAAIRSEADELADWLRARGAVSAAGD